MTNVISLNPPDDPGATPDRPGEPTTPGRTFYTAKEVAEMLAIDLGNTYAGLRAGQLPGVKWNGRWAIPRRRFHDWLNRLPEDTTGIEADPDPADVAYVDTEIREATQRRASRNV